MMRSLQTRMMVGVSALALAALVAVAIVARYGARQEFRHYVEIVRRGAPADAVDTVQEIAHKLETRRGSVAALHELASTRISPPHAVLFIDPSGKLIAAAGEALAGIELAITMRRAALVVQMTRRRGNRDEQFGVTLIGAAFPVRVDGALAGTLHLIRVPGMEKPDVAAAVLGSLDRRLLLVTAIVGLAAMGLTWMLTRRIVGPIDELRVAVRDLAAGTLSRRVTAAGSDEIGELTQAFNHMASELERQQTLRRNLVHDVAHELRTPITAMRCQIEAVQDGMARDPKGIVQDLHEAVLDLGRLVEDLQELARVDARELRLDIGDVPVADVVMSALRASGLQEDARVRTEIEPHLAMRADRMRVRQILANLLTNAARHAPGDGCIRVTARGPRLKQDTTVTMEVSDNGPGLSSEEVTLVFERFYRTDPSRQRSTGGAGLGLAIVKNLVEAQGGRVWVTSAPGQGATFGFTLPLSQG